MAETMTCYRHPDRETGLSCSECGRPICVDCMTVAPVGIRCPEHATGQTAKQPIVTRTESGMPKVRTPHALTSGAIVTKVLVGLNLAVYLIGVAQGAGIDSPGGALYQKFWLYGPEVADGGWWRLITAAFLHAGLLHIAFNMLALWWLGSPVEQALGHVRYLMLYLVSGLAGSAGALIWSPNAVTVGASGAIFGLLGAGLILEYEATGRLAGNYLTLIVINLAFTLGFSSSISVGGHIGGLIGGILCALVLTRFGRQPTGKVVFSDLSVSHTVGLLAIGIASIVIAYWRVRGLA